MKKDVEWLRERIETLRDIDRRAIEKSGMNSEMRHYFYGSWTAIEEALGLLDQLDEPEVLSQEWIDEHAVAVAYDGMPDQTEIVYVDDLQSLLVPKQESTEEQARERETVASVFGDYLQMAARLKQILGMEVEVKDNEQKD